MQKNLHFIIAFLLFVLAAHAGDNKWTSNGPYGGNFGRFTFHPQNSNVIFAAGKHIYRSTNGGTVWTRLDLSDEGIIVRIHPENPGSLIAASYSVYGSTDQGTSWRQIAGVPFRNDFLRDLEFLSGNSQMLLGVTDINGVFKSTDGGKTWVQKNSGLAKVASQSFGTMHLEIDPAGGDAYVLLRNGKVYKSTDGGNSWQSYSNGLNLGGTGRGLAIDRKSPQSLYAAGVDEIYKTSNAGQQWASTNCGCRVRNIHVDTKHNIYAVGDDAVKSTDGGKTWKRLSVPRLADTLLLGTAVHPVNSNLVFVGTQREGIFRSQNSGIAWQRAVSGLDSLDVGHLAVHEQRANQLFSVGQLQVFQSRDNGTNWGLFFKGQSPLDWTTDFQIHPANPSLIGVAGCCTAAVSTNGGTSWKSIEVLTSGEAATSRMIAFDPQSQNVLYLIPRTPESSRALGIAKSADQGRTLNFINTGLTDLDVTAIRVDPRNGSILFAGTRTGKVFRSANAGGNWTASSTGLTAADRINSIVIDPQNSSVVYVAADNGVFKSINGGQTWVRKKKGLPLNFEFNFVAPDSQDSKTLFTGGMGLFISTDAGDSWSAFDTNGLVQDYLVYDFAFHPSQRNSFFIGTARGTFSYTRAVAAGAPVIQQLAPSAAKIGEMITVVGSSFGSTQGKVLFAGMEGTVVDWAETRIRVRVPSGAVSGPLKVLVDSRSSNTHEFIVLPSEPASPIQPASGSSSGGTFVTIIDKSGLSQSQLVNVLFGSNLARDVRFLPPNIITCVTPTGAGTVDVSIASSAVITRVGSFTYQ